MPPSSQSSVEPQVDILIDLTSEDCSVTKSIQSNIEDLTQVFLVDNDLSTENVDNNNETDRLLSDDPGVDQDESNTVFEDELSESTTPLN